jgi:hypothetical protein
MDAEKQASRRKAKGSRGEEKTRAQKAERKAKAGEVEKEQESCEGKYIERKGRRNEPRRRTESRRAFNPDFSGYVLRPLGCREVNCRGERKWGYALTPDFSEYVRVSSATPMHWRV